MYTHNHVYNDNTADNNHNNNNNDNEFCQHDFRSPEVCVTALQESQGGLTMISTAYTL